MSTASAIIETGPQWHLHRFDQVDDQDFSQTRWLHLSEELYRQASFLDQRIEPQALATATLSLQRAVQFLNGDPSPAPATRFIFHLGHCGSTLLSRALAASPDILPLREPLTLRQLATRQTQQPMNDSLLALVMDAHARVFRECQVAVIKATSICNNLIEPVLASRPDVKAVGMYVSLETYLAGLLGKQSPALDLRGHAPARLADWRQIPGAPALQPETMNDAELAVLAWLTGMRHLVAAAATAPGQFQMIDFQALLESPESCLTTTAEFFDHPDSVPAIIRQWPDISIGYSKKPDEPYSAFNRMKTLQRGRMVRGDEITHGLRWAESLISKLPSLESCQSYLD